MVLPVSISSAKDFPTLTYLSSSNDFKSASSENAAFIFLGSLVGVSFNFSGSETLASAALIALSALFLFCFWTVLPPHFRDPRHIDLDVTIDPSNAILIVIPLSRL